MEKSIKEPLLYIQIYDALKQRIESGEWGYGAVLPSEPELAEVYGVSRGTLRRVLAKLEDEDFIHRERGRGTFVIHPTVNTQNSRLNNYSISFIVPYILDSFVSSILHGLESVARENSYAVIFHHVENDVAKQEKIIREAEQQGVSGIVLYPVNSTTISPILRELNQKKYPLVLVDRYIRGLYFDYVTSDNFGGGINATQHLLALGHRRIAFLSWKDLATTMDHRRLGYRQALLEAGIKPDPNLEWEVKGYPEIDQVAIKELLLKPDRPTAIFAANDQLAISVQRVARSLQISVPEDLALVGFDDLDISAQLDIPLTTIAQKPFEIGAIAGDLILWQIRNNTTCVQRRILPVELIVRDSCGASETNQMVPEKIRR
jgi:DNA-binding LacI/PurR family transcriptional regulator